MGNIMVPLKKFLSNKNTITILGVLIGVVVLYVGYNWRVTKSIQPIEVPIASATLNAGTPITEESIAYTELPKEVIGNMSNIVTTVEDITGKLVSYDSKIPANSFFFSESLITPEEMPDSMYANLKDGYSIFSYDVDAKSTHGNAIMPGSRIDIFLSTSSEDGKVVYGKLINSLEVLAVTDEEGTNVFADRDNPGEPAIISFAVPTNLFLLLTKGALAGFTYDLQPRSESDTLNPEPTEIVSEELEAMIINKTYILTDECLDSAVC